MSLSQYPPLLRDLLVARGITAAEEAERFLNPDYIRDIHDPWLLKNMALVVERILRAILGDEQNDKGEKIIIFSDYDADGIPGAVALHDFFKKIGFTNFENYIPHRHEEGFGLNVEAIKKFAADGAKVVITIDCGIADILPARLAKELGLDLIITDHHEPLISENGAQILPEAYAILNPKQSDCEYPEKMLCGAGVIFKLVQALLGEIRMTASGQKPSDMKDSDTTKKLLAKFPHLANINDGWEKWLLDMVGLATLSDMVPLRGENRTLAFYGLKVLRVSPRIGLGRLLSSAGTRMSDITEDDISFTITPRINAASRMGVPMEAFNLLSTKDQIEAGTLAHSLNQKNDERKTLVALMARDINKRLEERMKNETLREVIVLGHPDWRPSLLGLVANTLKDDHQRPVFLWGREGGNGNGESDSRPIIKGSCRSDHSVSVVELMTEVKDLFLNFGGHSRSGGFSMFQEHIHFLEDRLVAAFRNFLPAKNSGATIADDATLSSSYSNLHIDKVLSIKDANWQTWQIIERLGPFGTGNPKPIFLFDDAKVVSLKQFGKQKNHLEILFTKNGEFAEGGANLNGKDNNRIAGIRFFSGPDNLSYNPKAGERVSVIASLEKSTFKNYPELRLRLIDVLLPGQFQVSSDNRIIKNF